MSDKPTPKDNLASFLTILWLGATAYCKAKPGLEPLGEVFFWAGAVGLSTMVLTDKGPDVPHNT